MTTQTVDPITLTVVWNGQERLITDYNGTTYYDRTNYFETFSTAVMRAWPGFFPQ